jgi:hypothetical protein
MKKRSMKDFDATAVRRALDYDPITGLLFWRVRDDVPNKVNKRFAGKPAGGLDGQYGYITVRIFDRLCQAHRLIWLIMTGEWPVAVIDHIDGNPSNNAWTNLRAATRGENNRNKASFVKSHLRGATFIKSSGKWMGQIMLGKRNHYLGLFNTEAEAHAAYCEAAARLHGGFARFS